MCRTQCVLALAALYVGLAHSWDIVLSQGDELIFYSNNRNITDTVNLNSRNLAVLDYDEVHNMILYVDKQSDHDAICGYILHSKKNRCFIKRNGSNIHSIAFEPATETLFFTDTNEMSINWISVKPMFNNNVTGNLLIKLDYPPSDIAVDSCRGYIYWTNTNITVGVLIERSRFNGSEREVINRYMPVDSMAVDPQTQKMYYMNSYACLNRKDLDGQNYYLLGCYTYFSGSKELTVSNDYLYWMNSYRESYTTLWQMPKNAMDDVKPKEICKLYNRSSRGVATNYSYNIKNLIQGCEPLSSLVPPSLNTQQTTECTTVAELFCVHGIKVNETSVCKCTPGYIGERCDVSVCENYCLEGDCSSNDEGLPKCRCNAGYSGERCEVFACHGYCVNNGDCSLNEEDEPVCQCKTDYVGDRCEVSDCLNYCIQGECGYNEEGLPKCRCNAGYSGERCEVYACHGYCLNNGDCSLNEEDEPVCQCVGNHEGTRCEAVKDDTVTFTRTNLTLADLLSNWQRLLLVKNNLID